MKKALALLLAILMLALCVSGCSGSETQETAGTTESTESAANTPTIGRQENVGGYTFPTIEWGNVETTEGEEEKPPIELEQLGYISGSRKIQHKDLEYVMIYNPSVYNEYLISNRNLSTGKIDNQINIEINRAGGLDEEVTQLTISQGELLAGLVPSGEREIDRALPVSKIYRKGDTQTFYGYNSMSFNLPRVQMKFTCKYAGEYCNIWVYNNSISDRDAKSVGEEFDANIYESVVEKFGTPRFDGPLNLLYYPMEEGIAGCFSGMDLLLNQELPYFGVQNMGANTGANLLHMNALYDPVAEDNISTMAHEFQHLICFTNAVEIPDYIPCETWFNEAMSCYIQEILYPGTQLERGRMYSYNTSDLIRNGMSLYNFTTGVNLNGQPDVGVYGAVYLYSMYVEALAGGDVFSNFHDYWRNSYSETLSVAEALVDSVPEDVYKAVDESVRYPTGILFNNFATEEEEWMSKLTLQFHLELLDLDESDPSDFNYVLPEYLLYDSLDPAKIEGGGRIIVALKSNSFEVPTLAGSGLIYVGLDENFEVLSISYS